MNVLANRLKTILAAKFCRTWTFFINVTLDLSPQVVKTLPRRYSTTTWSHHVRFSLMTIDDNTQILINAYSIQRFFTDCQGNFAERGTFLRTTHNLMSVYARKGKAIVLPWLGLHLASAIYKLILKNSVGPYHQRIRRQYCYEGP